MNPGAGIRSLRTREDSEEIAKIEQSLQDYILQQNWPEVVDIYKEHPEIHSTKITKKEDTALHVAVMHGPEQTVLQLLRAIEKSPNAKETLLVKNKQENTPLHFAALRGSKAMCKRMLDLAPSLIDKRNNDGETPLFMAALRGHKEAFLCIHYVSSVGSKLWRRNDGDTILHCTIRREHFDLAFQIIHLYKDQHIIRSVNERGITPLHILASKPSAFLRYTRFGFWTKILYYCIIVEPLKIDGPENIVDIDMLTHVHHNRSFPPNYATICDFIKSSYIYVLRLSGSGLLGIKNMKERHLWCAQIMNELVHSEHDYMVDNPMDFDGGLDMDARDKVLDKMKESKTHLSTSTSKKDNTPQQKEKDKNMTALLTAAKNGVMELVDKILVHIPVAIEDVNSENKNIFLVAVEHRQPHIFQNLRYHEFYEGLIQDVDVDGNNVLHMAARVSKYKPWRIPGAAMQMLWEIKWFQFVKENVPPHLNFQTNNEDQTPGETFHESHKDLLKEGSEWLKSTSESCSVVAALIAGVSFATSSSVPGGTNDQTGKPTLEGHPAFDLFTVTSLVALCFSVTALVMFLAILTSRHQPKDFRRDLPFKLLLGLSSLFVSIASILISFCAANFFVLEDKLNKVVFIIYAATCLPVSLYAVAQFPLYTDLLISILTKVPQPSYKDDDL